MSRFDTYARTPFGLRLTAIIDTPERYIEFRAFSREGFPAVTALVSILTPVLEPLRYTDLSAFNTAKQFAGWLTGMIMRRHGHSIVRSSASVPGKLFTVAAVWSGAPTNIIAGPNDENSDAA